MCRTGEFNLSYGSLTDVRTTRVRLNNLKTTDPQFYSELTSVSYEANTVPSAEGEELDEDVENDPDLDATFEDDSDVPLAVVTSIVSGLESAVPVRFSASGELSVDIVAELNEAPVEELSSERGPSGIDGSDGSDGGVGPAMYESRGKGKRVVTKSKRYDESALRWWKDH